MPETTDIVYLTTREEWREWLKENHNKAKDVWLVYYKKHTGKPTIPYNDAVEEALCFGWIDSTVKRIDDEKHVQRYTPRKSNSVWSESNKKRVNRMIRQKRMTPTGMALVRAAKKNGQWMKSNARKSSPDFPDDLIKALTKNQTAQRNFEKFAPSYKRHYLWWIGEAKRADTRERRIAKVVEWSADNKKPGML